MIPVLVRLDSVDLALLRKAYSTPRLFSPLLRMFGMNTSMPKPVLLLQSTTLCGDMTPPSPSEVLLLYYFV